MSLYSDDRYSWRETYFVFFEPERRPLLCDVHRELNAHAGTFRILAERGDAANNLQSLTVASYEDHSALEVAYQEGEAVTAEIGGILETLGRPRSTREREKHLRLARCRAKFDLIHFEQTAGTAAFQIVKMPELQFTPPRSRRSRFRFDPEHYQNCAFNGLNAVEDETDADQDSAVFERVDPNTLVLILEILTRLSHGIALDPASGIVM